MLITSVASRCHGAPRQRHYEAAIPSDAFGRKHDAQAHGKNHPRGSHCQNYHSSHAYLFARFVHFCRLIHFVSPPRVCLTSYILNFTDYSYIHLSSQSHHFPNSYSFPLPSFRPIFSSSHNSTQNPSLRTLKFSIHLIFPIPNRPFFPWVTFTSPPPPLLPRTSSKLPPPTSYGSTSPSRSPSC